MPILGKSSCPPLRWTVEPWTPRSGASTARPPLPAAGMAALRLPEEAIKILHPNGCKRIKTHNLGYAGEEASPVSGRSGTVDPVSRMRCLLEAFRILFAFLAVESLAPGLWGQSGTSTTPNVTLPGNENPFRGSEPEAKPTPDVLQIDFKDAIDRGLRRNLGLLLAGDQTQFARGERWKELAEPLPNISGGCRRARRT